VGYSFDLLFLRFQYRSLDRESFHARNRYIKPNSRTSNLL
jgi:hypothetical protein